MPPFHQKYAAAFFAIVANRFYRRKIAKEHMMPHEYPITLTTFPRIGCPGQFTDPYYPVSGPKLRSQFVPDEIANPHIRFPTLAANIRTRRGRKVQVNVPVFRDVDTPWPWKDPTVNYNLHNWPEDADVRNGASPDNFIHMDAMAFGMGSCCLQITFQAKNITEGRQMYDQLSPLGPIMLALTAATPMYKGFLADTDVRWNQISNAVDDRTPEEMGELAAGVEKTDGAQAAKRPRKARWRIPKSRYASNSTYISTDPRLRPEYMDSDLVIDPSIKAQLEAGGMDSLLATHFAHLFIRDPIVIFAEDLQTLDLNKTDHFENIQSTNWQHMRFKPPPADNSIGWRVEFRPMEIQLTDFENAAFSVFMVLVTRVILSFDLNFYIPIARVDENMATAHKVDAVVRDRFWFRKNPFPTMRPSRVSSSTGLNGIDDVASSGSNEDGNKSNGKTPAPSRPQSPVGPVEDEYTLMSIDEIINGTRQARYHASMSCDNGDLVEKERENADTENIDGDDEHDFPGLIPLVESYLDSVNVDVRTRCELATYLNLIRQRASGKLWTTARWIREFVAAHPAYCRDSVVSEDVTRDLVGHVVRIGEREASNAGFAGLEKEVPGWENLMGRFRRTTVK